MTPVVVVIPLNVCKNVYGIAVFNFFILCFSQVEDPGTRAVRCQRPGEGSDDHRIHWRGHQVPMRNFSTFLTYCLFSCAADFLLLYITFRFLDAGFWPVIAKIFCLSYNIPCIFEILFTFSQLTEFLVLFTFKLWTRQLTISNL
jgi:hypothetical protein